MIHRSMDVLTPILQRPNKAAALILRTDEGAGYGFSGAFEQSVTACRETLSPELSRICGVAGCGDGMRETASGVRPPSPPLPTYARDGGLRQARGEAAGYRS